LENEKTSIIPPLTEKSPGSNTKSSLLNSKSNNCSFKISRFNALPTDIFKILYFISFF